jgi:hypothetical protein
MERRHVIFLLSATLWLGAVGVGLRTLWDYELSPGVPGNPPVRWPAESQLQRVPGRATLILLAHPHCPCTRASIGELALLMARLHGQVTAYVLFARPQGVAAGWEQTALWDRAAAIPGVQVWRDDANLEARCFQAATSGQTVLYDAQGRLLFSGGITASRGHSGDNAGRSAIVALLTQGVADRSQTFVFGCSLLDAHARSAKEGKYAAPHTSGGQPPSDCAADRGSL